MLFTIIESGETKELGYIHKGIDATKDMLENYDALQYDYEIDEYVLCQDDFDWWTEIFAKMERIDELIEALKENYVNYDCIYEVDNADLEYCITVQLGLIEGLLKDNGIEQE